MPIIKDRSMRRPIIVSSDEALTPELVSKVLKEHARRLPRYESLLRYYEGEHDILTAAAKPQYKPDNRIVSNFAKYIVDTFNGYFIGRPVGIDHADDETAARLQELEQLSNQNDVNAELAKMTSIYGHAYEYLYTDEEARPRTTYVDPRSAIIVYDDSVQQRVRFGFFLNSLNGRKARGVAYDDSAAYEFETNDEGRIVFKDMHIHLFGRVPMIEYVENDERLSAFENVDTLIDAFNKAVSEKANDVDYFADAYLAILGAPIAADTLEKVRDNRIINIAAAGAGGSQSGLKVDFLDKPAADDTQENLINRLERLIFQMSMVVNINDETFATSSGIALKYKLQSMENLSLMKERKFSAAMMERYKMLFGLPGTFSAATSEEDALDVSIKFERNVPIDVKDEAEAAGKLSGITSKRTQLAALSSLVPNVQAELELIEEEADAEHEALFSREFNTPIFPAEEDE